MDDLVRLLDLFELSGGKTVAAPGLPDGAGNAANIQESGDQPLAIATVVNTRGSVYRRPGARMLVRQSLSVSGAVSAGCLERDIIANCQGIKPGDQPFLLTYDGSSPDELLFGLKLGCDGIVQILVEPVEQGDRGRIGTGANTDCLPKYAQVRQVLPSMLSQYGRVAAVTVFAANAEEEASAVCLRPPLQTGLVLLEAGSEHRFLAPLPAFVCETLRREASIALLKGDRQSLVVEQNVGGICLNALIEIVEPVTEILIFGSGQDIAPLVDMARVLGWNATVISAQQIDKLDLSQLSQLSTSTQNKAAIVMTHDYERDSKVLQALLGGTLKQPRPGNFAYIGIVGPRRRSEKLMAELALAGISLCEAELARLYSPVGLDIGAERPEEIALSILAEIKAVLAGHRGGLLREKQGSIHEPVNVKRSKPEVGLPVSEPLRSSCRLGDA